MSDAIEYVVNSFAWSAIGFTVGWLVASLRTDVHSLKEALVPTEEARTRRLKSTQRATRVLGTIVALLAIATVVQGFVATRRLNEISDCQSTYNRHFAAATKTRAQLAEEDRQALVNLLLSLYQQRDETEQQRLHTFEQWVKTTEANERERRQHPLPSYPSDESC